MKEMTKRRLGVLAALCAALALIVGLMLYAGTAVGAAAYEEDCGDGNHSCSMHEQKLATCTEEGHKAYFQCDKCGKYFMVISDGAGGFKPGNACTWENRRLEKLSHQMTEHECTATCTEGGERTYYHCSLCELNYADQEGTEQLEDVNIGALGHEMQKHEKKEATCTESGMNEYWHCTRCNKDFADEDGEAEAGVLEIPALGHEMQKHEKKEATCTESGMNEYWHCTRCNKDFADEDGEAEAGVLEIPALGHTFKNGECTVCGAKEAEKKPSALKWLAVAAGTLAGVLIVAGVICLVSKKKRR